MCVYVYQTSPNSSSFLVHLKPHSHLLPWLLLLLPASLPASLTVVYLVRFFCSPPFLVAYAHIDLVSHKKKNPSFLLSHFFTFSQCTQWKRKMNALHKSFQLKINWILLLRILNSFPDFFFPSLLTRLKSRLTLSQLQSLKIRISVIFM